MDRVRLKIGFGMNQCWLSTRHKFEGFYPFKHKRIAKSVLGTGLRPPISNSIVSPDWEQKTKIWRETSPYHANVQQSIEVNQMKPWCLTNTHPECGAWAHKTAKQNVIFSTASVSEKIPNLEQWNQQNAREQIGEQHVRSWAILVLFVVVFLRSNVTVKMRLYTHKIQQGFMFVKLILASCVCHSSSQVVLGKGLLWC